MVSRRSLLRLLSYSPLFFLGLSVQKSLAQQIQRNQTSIRQAATGTGRFYGAALNPDLLHEPEYAAVVARECNIAVAENAFKWGQVESPQGKFNFEGCDKIAAFCKQHNIALRGHCLLWHSSLPDWLPRNTFPPLEVAEPWITAVMQRYPDVIAWDVFNEVIDDQENDRPFHLRFNATPEYVRDVFRLARRINGDRSELVYNDYGTEGRSDWNLRRQNNVLGLLRYLKEQDAGITGFGIQSHLRTDISASDLAAMRTFIRAVKALGLKVYATELDFVIKPEQVPQTIAEGDRLVADAYRRYLEMLFSEGVNIVLTWGITDRYSWVRREEFSPYRERPELNPFIRPLLFDDQYRPKAAYSEVLRAFSRSRSTAGITPLESRLCQSGRRFLSRFW